MAADFLPIGRMLRQQGADDKDIRNAFNQYVEAVEKRGGDMVSLDKKQIGGLIGAAVDNARSKIRKGVDYFDLFCKAGFRFQCNYPIGKIKVDFMIEKKVIFEIAERTMDQRVEYLEGLGYDYISLPKYLADMCPDAVVGEIRGKL